MSKFEGDGAKHSDREVADFVKTYTGVIYKACSTTPLCRADWDTVVYEVAVKFADGRLEYDPSKKASMATFVYTVARNEAINTYMKSRPDRCTIKDPAEILELRAGESFTEGRMTTEDCLARANEALNRLSAGCRNPKRIAIFIRHVLFLEPREVVAKRFGVSINTVSMAKTHLLPKFRRHLDDIAEEEARGLYSKRGDKVFLRKEDFSS